MKITYIYGNMKHYDHGLSGLLKRAKNIFAELEAENETIDLGALHPPYYDGETTNALDGVMEKLRASDGIVFACTAQMFAPTALMQSFFEYLTHPDYADALAGKHAMIIALSRAGGEKSALDYLARAIQHAGGFVAATIGLQKRHLDALDGEIGDFVDKTTEDFYRAVHQNRKYIVPADFAAGSIPATAATETREKITEADDGEPDFVPEKSRQLSVFSDSQEKEIEELSALFSKKYSGGEALAKTEPLLENGAKLLDAPAPTEPSNPFAPTAAEAAEISAAERLTQSLPSCFQPQLSAGLQAVIQINITGSEAFEGFLYIHSTECTYTGGTAPAPDIIIMADTKIWLDVLRNKNTAQKAFMTGGIKVRGDFALLTRFDSLFEFPALK